MAPEKSKKSGRRQLSSTSDDSECSDNGKKKPVKLAKYQEEWKTLFPTFRKCRNDDPANKNDKVACTLCNATIQCKKWTLNDHLKRVHPNIKAKKHYLHSYNRLLSPPPPIKF